jgi:cytidine deaminase
MPPSERDIVREAALRATRRAYVPYSDYPVGAACVAGDGSVHVGCNIENASFGLTVCAEVAMVGAVIMAAAKDVRLVSCRHGSGAFLTPCGRCRQVLLEHFGPDCRVDLGDELVPLGDLLPRAWTGVDLREPV